MNNELIERIDRAIGKWSKVKVVPEFYKLLQDCKAALTQQQDDTHGFKNFHKNLCERFGYGHDEIDWGRDQVSLIEHIAALTQQQEAEPPFQWASELTDKLLDLCLNTQAGDAPKWADINGLVTESLPPKPAAQTARCEYCDGSGDVHSFDGEWLGSCAECPPAAQPQVPEGYLLVPVDVVEAVANIGVDFGYGPYALEQSRIEQMRILLSAAKEEAEDV